MIKKNIFILLISVVLFSGCIQIESPLDTIEAPKYTRSDELMEQYKALLRNNESPGILIDFLKKHIKEIHENENNSNIAVMRLIDLQKENLRKHTETANSEDFIKIISNIDSMEAHDIADKDKREWYTKLLDDGYKIEDGNILIKYEEIKEICYNYVTDDIKYYIDIESKESEEPFNENNALRIDKEILAKRINDILTYIKKYENTFENSPYISRMNTLRKQYLEAYMFGLPNSSVFEYYLSYTGKIENRINKEWLDAYKNIVKTSKSDDIGIITNNFLNKLKDEGYVLNKVVYDYIKKEIEG